MRLVGEVVSPAVSVEGLVGGVAGCWWLVALVGGVGQWWRWWSMMAKVVFAMVVARLRLVVRWSAPAMSVEGVVGGAAGCWWSWLVVVLVSGGGGGGWRRRWLVVVVVGGGWQ